MLVQTAWAASRTKNTYLGSKYKRLASHMSGNKALIALARIMLVSIYYMIKKKERYKDLGANYLENLFKEKTVKNLKKKLESFGYSVKIDQIVL